MPSVLEGRIAYARAVGNGVSLQRVADAGAYTIRPYGQCPRASHAVQCSALLIVQFAGGTIR